LTELISIAENAGKAGLPIPAKLTKVLAQLQEKE
jgi:phage-related holin